MKNIDCLLIEGAGRPQDLSEGRAGDLVTDEIDSSVRYLLKRGPHLYHDSSRGLRTIAGDAHIVIALRRDTTDPALTAYFLGDHDCTYGCMSDAKLLEVELPKLLAELRQQLNDLAGV